MSGTDPDLHDPDLHDEIELLGELVIAASESVGPLSTTSVDAILGVTPPDQP
jgi:hypothetical protein